VVAPLVAALLMTLIAAAPAGASGPLIRQQPPLPSRGTHPTSTPAAHRSLPTGRLIVTYRAAAAAQDRRAARASVRATFVKAVALPNAELVQPAGDVGAALAELQRRPEVASVEREYRRAVFGGPTGEPLIGQQWALNNTGQTVNGYPGVRDVDMNVFEAWNVTTGSSDVVVAVIDDGVDFSHPDLAGQAWVNPGEIAGNGIDDDLDGLVDDVNGWDFCHNDATLHDAGEDFHGTHVAGSIAAAGNGIGVVGIAPKVRIMALKFINSANPDDPSCGQDTQAVAAIAYAKQHGARIINASWGGYDNSAALETAIRDSGLLFVAAAGNDDSNNDVFPMYPAAYQIDTLLSVASVHNQGYLSSFSNYGPQSVAIAAPGEDILSTIPEGAYDEFSGTSMAAANASGVAALAASAHPSLGSTALRAHLIATARALPMSTGWIANPRMVDARGAVVGKPDIRRLAGTDRYATAAAISAATYVPHVRYLLVANGLSFPDALAGGAVAAQFGAPLLLVKPTSIPTVTLNEIKRLKPQQIFVLGGTGVVSNSVLTQLAAYDGDVGGPYRLAGADRYSTAAAISAAATWSRTPTVFIANGLNFPDALAGGAVTPAFVGPVLLTLPTGLPQATRTELARLQPTKIVILGGTGSVSTTVGTQLKAYVPSPARVERWAGADRYATAQVIASHLYGLTPAPRTVFLASGTTFPDGLSGDPPAGAYGGALLLTRSDLLPVPTKSALTAIDPVRIFVLGGTGVVSDAVMAQVRALFP
jgi:subtilisin family serine protease